MSSPFNAQAKGCTEKALALQGVFLYTMTAGNRSAHLQIQRIKPISLLSLKVYPKSELRELLPGSSVALPNN